MYRLELSIASPEEGVPLSCIPLDARTGSPHITGVLQKGYKELAEADCALLINTHFDYFRLRKEGGGGDAASALHRLLSHDASKESDEIHPGKTVCAHISCIITTKPIGLLESHAAESDELSEKEPSGELSPKPVNDGSSLNDS